MAATEARRERVLFTQSYEPAPAPAVFVGTEALIDIETATIAVQAGTIHEDHLRATGRTVQTHATATEALDAVLDGAAGLVFGSPAFLEPRVYRTSRMLAITAREALDADGAAIAFRKDDTALRDRFDAALDAMRADGSLEALIAKWLPQETTL